MPPFMHSFHMQAYALMRIVVGFLFLCRGTSVLLEFPIPPPSGVPHGLGVLDGPRHPSAVSHSEWR